MDNALDSGSVFREIIPLSRINDIVKTGVCRMSALYFMKKGYVYLDTQGCIDILQGYIDTLNNRDNFQIYITDKDLATTSDSCTQIKRDLHVAINYWGGVEPVMVHSDQVLILKEFQNTFDKLYASGEGFAGSKNNVISILNDAIKKLKDLISG